MKNMIKLGLSLALFASVACVMLSLVNDVTSPIIAATKEAEVNSGLSVVFPDADSFEKIPNFTDTTTSIKIESLYLAKKDGKVVGAVVQATGPTYDKATILLGIDMNRVISGIQFLSISDTPGFGQNATEPSFYTQFAGKSADDSFIPGNDVDMISGATITTKGVAQIVQYAAYVAGKYLAENYGAISGNMEEPIVEKTATVFSYDEAIISLFPPEQYPNAIFTEIEEGLGRVIRNMIIEKQILVTIDDSVIGAMVAVRGQTYKSGGVVLTAVNTNHLIIGSRIIELNDTPNIGQLALEESFYNQFAGKHTDNALLISSGIDAISGATITSACIADMVKVGAMEADNLAAHGKDFHPSNSGNYLLNEIYREE